MLVSNLTDIKGVSVADLRILGLWRSGPEGPLKMAARSAKNFEV